MLYYYSLEKIRKSFFITAMKVFYGLAKVKTHAYSWKNSIKVIIYNYRPIGLYWRKKNDKTLNYKNYFKWKSPLNCNNTAACILIVNYFLKSQNSPET